jgi:chromosome segregation ATPase
MALVLGLGTGIAPAQDSTSSVPLGDLARQLKTQRAKSQEKPKVFTNDDLAALPSSGVQTAPSPVKSLSPTAKEATSGEQTHGEEYYRKHMGKLQDRLEIDQRELSVLEQKLGQNQMQYYPDPNKGLLQESGPTALSDIHNLQDQIDKKKAEITADQEAIDDLREQLRREGGDAGWLRAEPSAGQAANENQPEKPENKKGAKEYWQSRFKSARARLAAAEEQQQLAEDELNLLQIQDARELDPTTKAELADKIKAKENEVSGSRAAIEEAQKTLEDLQDEFKASGAADEWSEIETETSRE